MGLAQNLYSYPTWIAHLRPAVEAAAHLRLALHQWASDLR